MSRAVVKAVAEHLEASLPANVPVHQGGVSGGPTDRFVVIRANVPDPVSEDLAHSRSRRDATLWITAQAEDGSDRHVAAEEALWLAERVQVALIDWRMNDRAWKPVQLTSQPVTRDEDYPDRFAMYVVTQYGISYQP